MKETQIENKVVEKAKKLGFYVRKYKTEGVNGSPDRIYISPKFPNEVFFIEFKKLNKPLRTNQIEQQKLLESYNKQVFRIDTFEEGLNIFIEKLNA